MKYEKRILSVVTGAMLVGSLAFATQVAAVDNINDVQNRPNPPATQGIGSSQETFEQGSPLRHESAISLVKASEFMKVDVFDSKNKKFAEVKDLAIDVPTGRINYVVVSVGGTMGVGGNLVAMPPEAFRVFRNNDEVKLDITREQAKQLPTLPKDNWLTTVDQQALATAYKTFKLNSPSHAGTSSRLSKASDLMGAEVAMTRQESQGAKLKDLALDLQEGYAPYAILSVGGVAGVNDKLTAVPTNALTPNGDKHKLQIAISEAQLKAAPEIDQQRWDRALSDRKLGETLFSSYGTTPYWDLKNGTQGSAVGGSRSMDSETVEGRGNK